MIERKASNLVCECGKLMEEVSKDDELIAYSCRCGLRLVTVAERERMNQHQRECQDGIVGRKAREESQIRQLQRLEFNDQFSPYKNKTSRAKWVPAGYKNRKKLKVKKYLILAGVCFIITSLILLIV